MHRSEHVIHISLRVQPPTVKSDTRWSSTDAGGLRFCGALTITPSMMKQETTLSCSA